MIRAFLGYDHQPPVNRATLFDAARSITDQQRGYEVTSWETLRIDGQLVIARVTDAIDSSELALFDLTTLNPNVLFELGYSIAKKRKIGILLEAGSADAESNFRQYGLLRGIGYFSWTDRASIIAKVVSGEFETNPPLGDVLVASAGNFDESSLLFIPALHGSEPDTLIRGLVQRASDQRIHVMTADPGETRLEPLNWYASKAYSSAATLLHLESPRRTDHGIHNARLALVGGLAFGFGRAVLTRIFR